MRLGVVANPTKNQLEALRQAQNRMSHSGRNQTMKKTIASTTTLFVLALSLMASATRAGLMDYLPSFGDDSPDMLIITANYAKPRLLAELVQMKKNHPILLISPEQNGDQIFYMPEYPDARLIPNDKLIDFLAVLSPKQIVVLGDENYVPTSYVKTIRNRYPLVLITGEDWVKNAKALADTVDYSKLVDLYREYLGQLLDDQIKRAGGGQTVNMEERLMIP
jgi:hypothetical protein